MTKVTVIV